MPLIDVTLPIGALDDAACRWLVDELLTAAIRWEGAPDNERSRFLARAAVHTVDAARVAGAPSPAANPTYRVDIRAAAGVLDDQRRAGLVAEATELVLRAEGSRNTPEHAGRVWVILDEIRDGSWGVGGRIWRRVDLAGFVAGNDALPAPSVPERLVRP